MQLFRGGLVFKAHRLCVSLNARLESHKKEKKKTVVYVPCSLDSGLDIRWMSEMVRSYFKKIRFQKAAGDEGVEERCGGVEGKCPHTATSPPFALQPGAGQPPHEWGGGEVWTAGRLASTWPRPGAGRSLSKRGRRGERERGERETTGYESFDLDGSG